MSREIAKGYEPREIEEKWARVWVDERLFTPERAAELRQPTRGTFSLAIPPPNVTGSLHMGHMLEHTQIDILMRWRRMQGYETLWLPGMDHAGIATQVVVERELVKEGLTRAGLGREAFERRVWEWKAQSGGRIKTQMRRMGVSVDWTREKFTLEPELYTAVNEAFLRLYRDGKIYRGRYLINWCPRCMTALSDLEVEHTEKQGKLWHLRYPVMGTKEFVVVATTRPETMLGDTAVAVHPEDERYRHLVGKKVLLPLLQREIPVIADTFVDREFGTGAVKVTPAHDPNDFEAGKRNGLEEIDVMTEDGKMNAAAGAYAGLDRYVARKRVVADLEALGLVEKVTEIQHSVGTCQRCKTEVEPRISEQWFCKMKPLAEPAVAAVEDGLIEIVPDYERKKYFDWMEKIHDWCISRQLWWGHRIPVWHCGECKGMTAMPDPLMEERGGRPEAVHPPGKCAKCGSGKIVQDADVLDTWFSSGLWPFSTLGWPRETADLKKFYPTSLMINGFDILFFWDVRMIMMGLAMKPRTDVAGREGQIPFRKLYIHALVRDAEGVKMSKTRGNVMDPLELTEKFGTDAVRFSLAVMAAPGTDIALGEERLLSSRAFANKIWNAARFLLMNLEKFEATGVKLEELASPEVRAGAPYAVGGKVALEDRWIFSRLSEVTAQMAEALENFRFHEAAETIYHFFWGEFCDWYIEWVKVRLLAENREEAVAAWRNLFAAFETALRLLHPVMPFITEELWHGLPQKKGAVTIALAEFPEARGEWVDAGATREALVVQEMIGAARNLRAELKVEQKKKVAAEIFSGEKAVRELAEANREVIVRLATLSELRVGEGKLEAKGGAVRSAARFDLRVEYEEVVDAGAEAAKLKKERERLEKDLESKRGRLADESFRAKAPAKVVEGLEATLKEREEEYRKVVERLRELGGKQ